MSVLRKFFALLVLNVLLLSLSTLETHITICVLFGQFGLSACVPGKPGPLIKYLLTLKEGNRRVDPQTGETALVPFLTPLRG